MVLVHGIFWSFTHGGWIAFDRSSAMFGIFRAGTVIGLLPMMLPTLAGAALAHRLAPRLELARRGADFRTALSVSLTGLFLVACGVLTNVLAAGWFLARAWNVLQFLGLSFQLVALCLLFRSEVALAASAVVALAVAAPLREAFPAESLPMWRAVLLGDPGDFHAWPFLPWYPTLVAGWFVGRTIPTAARPERAAKRLFVLAGIVVLAVAPFGGLSAPFDPDNLIGPAFMIPGPLRVVGLAALAALLLAGATAFLPRPAGSPSSFVRVWSGGILAAYVVHMAVGNRAAGYIAQRWDRAEIFRAPLSPRSLLLWLFPVALVLLAWLAAWASVRLFADRRVVIRIRRAARPASAP